MCYICDGKRDLRVIASTITLISSIDFDRARMVLMTTQLASERIREIIDEESGGGDAAMLDLDTLLPVEDQTAQSLKAVMMMTGALEEALVKIDALHSIYGPFTIPGTVESRSADAFSTYLGELLGGMEGEDIDHDEEV